MSEATSTTQLPSSALCDRIAVVTEEGLELESRTLAFAGVVREVLDAFATELEALSSDHTAADRAAVRGGLGVLRALVERMDEALGETLGPPFDAGVAA
jgi:hypothetical protein